MQTFFTLITFNSNAFRRLYTPSSGSSRLFLAKHQNDKSTYSFHVTGVHRIHTI